MRYLHTHKHTPLIIQNTVSSWLKWLDECDRTLQTPTFASRSALLDHTRIPDARSSPDNLWLRAAKACAANRCCGLPQEAPEDPFLCGRGILQVWFYSLISSDVTDGKEKNLLQKLGQATWQQAVWLLGHRAVFKIQSNRQPIWLSLGTAL